MKSDLQLRQRLRLGRIYIPWFHLAFISPAHTDADIDEILQVLKGSVTAIATR